MTDDKHMNFEINSFIIYDPTLSTNDDDESKKILYCHPKSIIMAQRMKTIGLCEAMCNFAKEFTDSSCQFIHTLKTRIIMHQLENNMTIILTVNIPKKSANSDDYLDEDVQNSICEIILKHCRQMFFLFMGPPSYIIEHDGVDILIEKLARFFDRYIDNGMLDGYQITDGLPGVILLPTDKEMYNEAQKLVNKLETKFPEILGSLLLFNNNLVYFTVHKDDLPILYRYLTTTLLAQYHANEAMNSSFTSLNMGKFIIGAPDLSKMSNSSSLPKVFLKNNEFLARSISEPMETLVLVYKALQASIVFFVDKNLNDDYLIEIHNFLGPDLTKFTYSLSQKSDKFITETPYKYIYWNPDTLSVKCTLFPTRQWKSEFPPYVPIESMRAMTDIKREYNRHDVVNNKSIKEMAMKLQSDSWIIGIENHGKQLFVAINKRNYSLVDVSKEMRHLCSRDFPNVFKLEME